MKSIRDNRPAPFTMEDILANPSKYGAPTFKEFSKNPQRYRRRADQQMITLTDGPQNFRSDLKKIRFFCHGLELPGEEAVEKMLADHGYSLDDIDLENKSPRLKKTINAVPVGGGRDHEIHINFYP